MFFNKINKKYKLTYKFKYNHTLELCYDNFFNNIISINLINMITAYQKSFLDQNTLLLKLIFITLCVILAIHWQQFQDMPKWPLSSFSILWAMCVYRGLNKNNMGFVRLLIFGGLVRLGWAVTYSIYSNGTPFVSYNVFFNLLVETIIFSILYAMIPYKFVQKIWSTPICRWFIFVFDQPIMNGWKFAHFVNKQIVLPPQFSIVPILLISFRAVLRPLLLIMFSIFNKNLNKKNLMKWIKISLLNVSRTLTLLTINYIFLSRGQHKLDIIDTLEYFNLCYFGFMGYLMFLQTYKL